MARDFDLSAEMRGLRVPTLIVAADADMAPPSHYVEAFKLLDGGLRVLARPQAAPILDWLGDCIELCGRPLELMSDNGSPFVVWMPGVLTLFGKTLADLHVRHLRTQVNSPWTNGKIERFWGVLQAEVLDRELLPTPATAEAALARFSVYYHYHRLHGELGWQTPAERFEGAPFTDQGFEHVPALAHLQGWLTELMAA
ncbi:MAG: integrase core domain-containing protein [Chloroflexota bacterium]